MFGIPLHFLLIFCSMLYIIYIIETVWQFSSSQIYNLSPEVKVVSYRTGGTQQWQTPSLYSVINCVSHFGLFLPHYCYKEGPIAISDGKGVG